MGVGLVALLGSCTASGQSTDGRLGDAEGMASYYGDDFAGQTTANGETFDPNDFTAAHPTLPFNTIVRVVRTGSEAGQSVGVRINDRGPYADDRIIDVSEAAAAELGMIEEGIVRVRLEIVSQPDRESDGSKGARNGW